MIKDISYLFYIVLLFPSHNFLETKKEIIVLNYILKRMLLIIPTLFGILAVNFIIIQAAPGGPVEKAIAQIKGNEVSVTQRFTPRVENNHKIIKIIN